MEDLKIVEEASQNMMGKTICVLADAAALPALSFLKKFRSEFIRHVEEQGCPMRREAGAIPQAR
jgi:NADH-quinone oxidoreductase subunit F